MRLGLLSAGISPDTQPELRRVVILSNAIYLTLGILLIVYLLLKTPTFIARTASADELLPIIFLMICVACLALNRFQWYITSKILFSLSWIALMSVVKPIFFGTEWEDYIIHPICCIIASIIVHLLFSFYREKWLYILLISLTWLLTIFSIEVVTFYKLPEGASTFFQNGFSGWRIFYLIVAFFFNATLMYVLTLNHKFYQSLKFLTTQLEQKVEARTKILKEQNQRLADYAFFHSHVLRAPIGRIRGLLYLLNLSISTDEEIKIRNLLDENMRELDQATRQINEKLDEINLVEKASTIKN